MGDMPSCFAIFALVSESTDGVVGKRVHTSQRLFPVLRQSVLHKSGLCGQRLPELNLVPIQIIDPGKSTVGFIHSLGVNLDSL